MKKRDKSSFSSSKWAFGLESSIFATGSKRRKLPLSALDALGENNPGESFESSSFYIFYLAAFVILALFLGRLFQLSIVDGEKNRQIAENNRIRLVRVEAPRGRILDRNGEVLADTKYVYKLKKGQEEKDVTADQAKDLEKLGLASENFEGKLGKVTVSTVRTYPLAEKESSVVGYTTSVSGEDLLTNKNIDPLEKIGRGGVESTYDDFLHGVPGKKIIEVDSSGQKISVLGSVDAQKGRDIYLSLDAGLQRVAYDALKKAGDKVGIRRGALIVENPKTGEILSLVSLPSYSGEDIGRSVADLDKPFLNRAVSGTYPPGSVFKIITAFAGLGSGKINKDTEFEDTGQIEVGGAKFANWFFLEYGQKDGVVKIDRAIARSNDIFFYKVGQKIGLEPLHKMAIMLGYGQKSGIDLPAEAFGLVPDEVWKKSDLSENWFEGDTLHMAIGQGFLLTTPIQVSRVTSYVASGKLTKPQIVSRIGAGGGFGETKFETKVDAQNLVSDSNLNLVRYGMEQACQKGGTAFPFFDAPYKVACKTGTAEKLEGNPNAWFTVYSESFKNPIAVTVLIENGGQGSVVSAPVAREIMDWWSKNRN